MWPNGKTRQRRGEKKRQVKSDCRSILTFASRCALVTLKKDLISAFHHINDSSCLIAVALCYSETRTKANVLLWIRPFCSFFSGPPLALTHLLSINVCTTCRNNRPPAQLPVCLTHMNAHTQALPDMHTQTRTSLLTQAWMDANTRRQLTRAESVLRSSSILYFHNAQMWCSAVCVFSSLSPSPRSGFELYYFLLVRTFFSMWSFRGEKKERDKNIRSHSKK